MTTLDTQKKPPLYTQDLTHFNVKCEDSLLQKAVTSLLADPHPLLKKIEESENFDDLQKATEHLSAFKTIVVFGTGGSSLGAKSLVELSRSSFATGTSFSSDSCEKKAATPTLYFVDNVDPHTLDQLFTSFVPEETGFLVVSKSGSTAETLTQFLAALSFMKKALSPADLAHHFFIITEPTDSPLRALSNRYAFKTLDHPTDIGGRFSVFSCVGLLPALLAGISPEDVTSGARDVWEAFQAEGTTSAPAQGASASIAYEKEGAKTTVLMPYCDRLLTFAAWHRQLWAESLGKEGKGSLPAPALGTVDQHSQLQLFLEGPKDKFFTLITTSYEGPSQTFDKEDLACDSRLSYLEDKTVADLMTAEYRATAQTLMNHGCPVRLMTLPSLSPRSLGALMMHFILETMLSAELLKVNAFDQPAVEESKRLTRLYLKEGTSKSRQTEAAHSTAQGQQESTQTSHKLQGLAS